MYRRYTQSDRGTLSHSQVNRNRLKNAVIVLLVLAIAGLLVIGIPAMRSRGEEHTLFLQRIRSECDEAIRQTMTLSRNAGADSAAILARIRSNVYAIRTVNALNTSAGYRMLLSDSDLLSLQEMIDRYLSYITTGMDTGEYQTNLQTSLETLKNLTDSLE